MRVYAFPGILYGSKAPNAGELAAQPYDQIGDALAAELHARDPHHFTWLSKPEQGASASIYAEADRVHRAWLAAGVIARDPVPALYPYVIRLAEGGRRLGVMVLAGLEPPETGVIRPHEETLAKPLADRLALLEAMAVDLEPALLLSEDGGALDRLIDVDIAGQAPVVSSRDEFGHHHDLYRVSDPARIALYREVLAGPAAIADGHHRYKVGLRHAEALGVVGQDVPAAAKLAVVTSLSSPALAIHPIHRALVSAEGLEKAAALTVTRTAVDAASGTAFAAAVAAAPQPALGVYRAGAKPEIWQLAPATATTHAHLSEGARDLPVALLHGVLLPAMGHGPETATDGTVIYRSDPEVLWDMVTSRQVGLWLPPMDPSQFAAAIAHGDLLPPKSTRFLPKVLSGLVWAGQEPSAG